MLPRFVPDPALRDAIAEDRIGVALQPIFSLPSGKIVGAEALARPDDGSSATALFDRAAQSGLQERLSRLMQRKALRTAAHWTGPLSRLGVSINVLPDDIGRPGFDGWLLDAIDQEKIDPRRVTVEITEHAALNDFDAVGIRLERLRAAGVRIALDDFGTGFASLASLTSLPLDAVKIDRSLIERIVGCERKRLLVRTILKLASDLGFATVVEGVETADQLGLLTDWGCTLYQGFFRARPMDQIALQRFVANEA